MLDEDGNPVNSNATEVGEATNREPKDGHEKANKEAAKPQEGKKKRETRRTPNPRKHGGQARTTPKKRETPTVRQNHEHKNMTHYRDLKQHTHEVSRGISVLLRPSRRPGQNKQADPLRSSPRACDPRRSTLEDPPCDYRKSFPVRRRQGRNPSRQQEGW